MSEAPDYARLRMVKGDYGHWSGVRVTDCGRFRVEKEGKQKRPPSREFGADPSYAVYDLLKPNRVRVVGLWSGAAGDDFDMEVVWPNTQVRRLCDARDWIIERVEGESAVDRLAQIMQQTPSMIDASADGS